MRDKRLMMPLAATMFVVFGGLVWGQEAVRPSGPDAARADQGRDRPGRLYADALFVEMGEGDVNRAIELYRQIVEKFAGDRVFAPRALYRMGVCYFKVHQPEKSKKCFERLAAGGDGELAKQAKAHLRRLDQWQRRRGDEGAASGGAASRKDRLERILGAGLGRSGEGAAGRREAPEGVRRRVERMRRRLVDGPADGTLESDSGPAVDGLPTPGQRFGAGEARRGRGPGVTRPGARDRTASRVRMDERHRQVLDKLGIRPDQPGAQIAAMKALADAFLRIEALQRELESLRAEMHKGRGPGETGKAPRRSLRRPPRDGDRPQGRSLRGLKRRANLEDKPKDGTVTPKARRDRVRPPDGEAGPATPPPPRARSSREETGRPAAADDTTETIEIVVTPQNPPARSEESSSSAK